jgi:tRNA dimethylallyltransferase
LISSGGKHIPKPYVIILQGPTGVGKTEVAFWLAEQFPIEIINADSLQVYRHLDIGTSKPAPDEQQAVPHHLLSIINPDEEFSAAQFKDRARSAITEIISRDALPLVVGGTGLYIRALTRGLCATPGKNEDLRSELREKAQREGTESMFKLLQEKDPLAAQRINPNDLFRIIRALEVFYLTGVPISRHQSAHGFQDIPFETLKLGLMRDRKELYQRIEKRVDQMTGSGLLQEVQSVLKRGYGSQLKALQSIGYKQMVSFLDRRSSWEEAVSQMKRDTKRFAKRQLTWFRRDPEIDWILLPDELSTVATKIKNFLKIISN